MGRFGSEEDLVAMAGRSGRRRGTSAGTYLANRNIRHCEALPLLATRCPHKRLGLRAGGIKGVLAGGSIKEGVYETPQETRALVADGGAVTSGTVGIPVSPCSVLHQRLVPLSAV